MTHKEKIRKVVEETEQAMGASLIKHFPTATDGSTDPLLTVQLGRLIERFAEDWVGANVPVEV